MDSWSTQRSTRNAAAAWLNETLDKRQSIAEVFVHAPARELIRRYQTRARDRARHPGFDEAGGAAQLQAHLETCHDAPLKLADAVGVLELDTTRPAATVPAEALAWLESLDPAPGVA